MDDLGLAIRDKLDVVDKPAHERANFVMQVVGGALDLAGAR